MTPTLLAILLAPAAVLAQSAPATVPLPGTAMMSMALLGGLAAFWRVPGHKRRNRI